MLLVYPQIGNQEEILKVEFFVFTGQQHDFLPYQFVFTVFFVICNMQRQKEKKCYISDGLPDEEIDGKWNFSVQEKLLSTKFSDVPKFYIELNGSGAFCICSHCSMA